MSDEPDPLKAALARIPDLDTRLVMNRLKDGVELKVKLNPRDTDSDDDGIKDGRENAGRITKVSATSITIKLAVGGRLTAGTSPSAGK